ncbi:MAG: insulinase family protein [Deltaproteobacteria bacterium]|nr:insulinase family protein [Deltaproteobacteria bacterium]
MRGILLFRALWLFLLLLPPLFPILSLASGHRPESFLLSNGMRVVVKKDSSSPLAALQLWVEAGAADEEREEAGLAHLLEHILFRGSSERGTGKLAGEVENLGGRINGFTSHDHTVYHMVLPAPHYKSGLRILAQMMQLPSLGEMAEPQLQKEIQVVLEEWKQGQDNPRSRANRDIFRTAYRVHPYGRAVIGTPETLKRITWEVLSRFYHRWYTAKNMILVVVGNFDSELAKKDITELFAALPGHTPPIRHRPAEPLQEQPRLNVVEAPIRQSHLTIGFHIPRATERDAPALDLLAFILGRGESSRLTQRIKTAQGLVNSISASTFNPREPGLFVIQAQLETGKTMEALRAIFKELYRLREEAVSPSELNRAHVNFLRTFVQTKETVQGQARQMGNFKSLYGNPDHEEAYLTRIRQLGAEELKSVAQAFFKTESLSVSLVVPEGTTARPDTEGIASLSRSLESPSLARRETGILKATLENGLKILIQEDRRLPVFSVHAGVIGGLLLEDDANNGIHNFIAAMLTQGSPRLTSSQLIHEVEHLGGILNGSAGNDTLSLAGVFPSQQAEKGLEIFLEVLLHPTFPEDELEKKRREILNRIENREERVRNQVFRLFYQTLFRNHPYRLHPAGEKEQVMRLSREDLIAHYQRLLSPERIVLTIVGDVDGETMLKRLQSKLSSLQRSSSTLSFPPAEEGISEARVEKKAARTKQAHLVLGFPAPAKGQSDYFTMKVLETILSRIGGRLFVEVRDKQGLAYSIAAFSLNDPLQGAFGIYAATDPATIEKMREEILSEIRRLQEEEVSSDELDRAKSYLIGNYLIARQTNASKAADLTSNELFGFGTDFSQSYQDGIQKVSAADIQRFARQYLSLDRYVLAIVGP